MAKNKLSVSQAVERDLRLDFFRGLGLWMIFLDHIPDDVVGWLTLRNYGFSDAAEFFVFISGYLAGYIYGPIIQAGNFLAATKRLMVRAWHLYIAHILLFLLFTAQIARAARKFDNPMYKDEFNVANFLAHPDELIWQALTLRYKPVDLDVLPLFVVLVLASPLFLWGLVRRPNLTLLGSAILYVLARLFDWNLASYPPGAHWYFNPFAWQLMFVFGAWCGIGGAAKIWFLIQSRAVFVISVAWILFAFFIVMTWHSHFLEARLPSPGSPGFALYPTPLGPSHFQLVAPTRPVRPTFASEFLSRCIPVVWRALHPGAASRGCLEADCPQHRRNGDHDFARVASGSG